jgi:AcrR family transcriptional regulator
MSQQPPTPLRADAQHNRERILQVAHDALAASPDASLNSIAKAAGVGPGTLYRHFPTREALVLAVYRHDVQQLVDSVPFLLREHPPLEALRLWFERLASYVKIKRGLGDALDAATQEAVFSDTYGPVIGAIAELLRANEAAGTIRPNLDPNDVLLLMGAIWRTGPGEEGDNQTHRLVSLVLDGLKTQSD